MLCLGAPDTQPRYPAPLSPVAGGYSLTYAAAMAAAAPPFFLLSTGATPEAMGWDAFLVAWAASAVLLLILASSISPIPGASSGSEAGSGGGGSSSSIAPGGGGGWLQGRPRLQRLLLPAAKRPRRNELFAVLAIAQSVLWMALLADEVVALFQTLGRIFSVPQDLLGATILAWGETLPDLIATLAVARAGQGTMAIASCFGGPGGWGTKGG